MNKIVFTVLASVSILFSGCVPSNQIVSPLDLMTSDSTRDIRITTIDGSIIVMKSGNYAFSRLPDSLSIAGKGRRIVLSDRYAESSFEGTLLKDQIARLELTDPEIPAGIRYPLYLLGSMALVVLAFGVWLGISLHGRGFGG